MNFEVLNDKNQIVMHTDFISCVPAVETITLMSRAGYKFRLDGKAIGVNKLKEYLREQLQKEV